MDPEQIPLRDLHLPAEIGWWPPAPGWWALIGIAAIGIGWLAYRAFLNWRGSRARRLALKQLKIVTRAYAENGDAAALAVELSELLRRVMLAYAPRAEVAGLTGPRWREFLDRGLEEPLFGAGAGRHIETLPYRRPESADTNADVDALIGAVRTRLETPVVGGNA